MTRGPDHREAAAYRIVGDALAATVVHRDDGTRSGEVDAHIEHSDGRRGALEVTVVGDPDTLNVEANTVAGSGIEIPDLAWRWEIRPGPKTRYRAFSHHVEILLRACEREGVTRPEHLHPRSQEELEALAWLTESDCAIRGNPDTSAPGTIDVLPPTMGGAVDTALVGLGDWLCDALTRGHLVRRVAKLARSGLPERHLFLIIHHSGMPFGLYYALATEVTVPAQPPWLPPAVTDIWLSTGWRPGGVLRFSQSVGWRREQPNDGW